MQAKEIGSSS